MGVPGCPELAFCTASIDSVRIVLMESSAKSCGCDILGGPDFEFEENKNPATRSSPAVIESTIGRRLSKWRAVSVSTMMREFNLACQNSEASSVTPRNLQSGQLRIIDSLT